MLLSLMYSKHTSYKIHNSPENGDSGYSEKEFIEIMKEFPQFIVKEQTMFNEDEYLMRIFTNIKYDDIQLFKKANKCTFILGYNDQKARKNYAKEEVWQYSNIYWCGFITLLS